jgi:membrane fusion protein
MSDLFREEAMHHRLQRSLGTVRITVPFQYQCIAGITFILLLGIIGLICIGESDEKNILHGYLDAEPGIAKVRTSQLGIVRSIAVHEKQTVVKGQLIAMTTPPEKLFDKTMLMHLMEKKNNLKKEYALKEKHYKALKQLYAKRYVPLSLVEDNASSLLELNNQIRAVDVDVLRYKQSSVQHIVSPVEGRVDTIFFREGQTVETGQVLVHIIPKDAHLVARVYAPVRQVGFIREGQDITLRYDAYPSQRFGVYQASISKISSTVLTDDQEDKPLRIGEPYYRLEANLAESYVHIYGHRKRLSYGMTFAAVVRGEKKKIWKWILDPIYSFYGET